MGLATVQYPLFNKKNVENNRNYNNMSNNIIAGSWIHMTWI